MQAIWSASQIQGGRDYQEDYFAVIENDSVFSMGEKKEIEPGLLAAHQSLYLLADGMGGMGHGDLAASTVINVFIDSFLKNQQLSLDLVDILHKSLLSASQAITALVEEKKELKGMGCTLIALLWDSQLATVQWVSVGDSLLGVMRDGQWQELNTKHIWRNVYHEKRLLGDLIDEQEAAENGDALYSAVDGTDLTEVDMATLAIQPNDVIIVASDGLEVLSPADIQQILKEGLDNLDKNYTLDIAFHNIHSIRQQLFAGVSAQDNKYQDNTSAIVIGFYTGLSMDL
ncbi:PP2C family protein-serine/threonine phosphatase [Methyloprofundus sp.]|uniref:PP2C family protein-serine/threonine phosphatase n=1 Tax=Methyloprofundus sp. TaxID=2020875 RepID=UPI003D106F15